MDARKICGQMIRNQWGSGGVQGINPVSMAAMKTRKVRP